MCVMCHKECVHVNRKRKRRDVSVEEQLSCCSLCQDRKDPISISCGHSFCRQCMTSFWDQSASLGYFSCPQCGKRLRTRSGLQTVSETSTVLESGLQEILDKYKLSLSRRHEQVTEDVNTQHEVRQLEAASKMKTVHDTPIKCHDIFKVLPTKKKRKGLSVKSLLDQQKDIRVVLTSGIAGIGKTFSVQKFTLDWAKGSKNKDISLVIPLSFRELNLIKDEQYSLLMLIHEFHPTLQKVTAETLESKDCKVLFIFDGLDESRLELDFNNRKVVSDVTQKSSVNMLFTNLIKGNLLPSALVWITSRPAAANQIPPTCVDRVTEVRGFTDTQKEKYFRKRFSNKELSSRIISHIKTSRGLNIMCQIPAFCWITATVLEHTLTTGQRGELPKTVTDMYSHFLLVQTKKMKHKYDEDEMSPEKLTEADREVILKLGKLAFEHLEKGNIMFYQNDLEQCGLDVTEALESSGFCRKVLKRENVIFRIKEFLAAIYMYHCYISNNTEVLKCFLGKDSNLSLDDFLMGAMYKSLQSKHGHLHLSVCFLHGLSLESNHSLLGGLLGWTENSPEIIQRVINNLKEMNMLNIPPDIIRCLMEVNNIQRLMSKSLNITFCNINGIKSSDLGLKTRNLNFNTEKKCHDIIIFQETWQKHGPTGCPHNYNEFIIPSVKNETITKGRDSGGMLIWWRSNLTNSIKIHKEAFTWLKIDKEIICADKDIYLCPIYIPPSGSRYHSESIFSDLESDIQHFKILGNVLICGDLNARTGEISDTINIQEDKHSGSSEGTHFHLPELPPRYNSDKDVNKIGKCLLELCHKKGLYVVNGRFLGDSLGYYTCSSANGNSTVDYAITDLDPMSLRAFIVNPLTPLSDHRSITVCLKRPHTKTQ